MVGLEIGLRPILELGEPLSLHPSSGNCVQDESEGHQLAVDGDLAEARCVNIVVVSSADGCRPRVVIPDGSGTDRRNKSAGISVDISH